MKMDSEEEKSKKVLDSLLEPFGLNVEMDEFKGRKFISMKMEGKMRPVKYYVGEYKIFLDEILHEIMQFVFYEDKGTSFVENPYFGCESLEEAFIKRDLMGWKGEDGKPGI